MPADGTTGPSIKSKDAMAKSKAIMDDIAFEFNKNIRSFNLGFKK
jgi:hypothetical protein